MLLKTTVAALGSIISDKKSEQPILTESVYSRLLL